MDGIRSWAVTVIATALALTVADMLLPEGSTRKYAKMAFSLVLMLVVVTPVVNVIVNKDFKVSEFVGNQNVGRDVYKTNEEGDYYSNVLKEYEGKLDEYIVEQARLAWAICVDVRLQIKNNPEKEDFGMIEKIEVDIESGNAAAVATKLANEFKLDKSMVLVKVVS